MPKQLSDRQITNKALARRVGISRQTMNAIENDPHAPMVDVAIRIADVFGITVDRLFSPDYEGKPARREKAVTITAHRTPATINEPVDIEREVNPVNTEVEQQNFLGNQRAVIGDIGTAAFDPPSRVG